MSAYIGCMASPRGGGQFGRAQMTAVTTAQGHHNQNAGSGNGTYLNATLDRLANNVNPNSAYKNDNSVVLVNLKRSSLEKPWGFRIQGGQDYNLQLTVKKVCRSVYI